MGTPAKLSSNNGDVSPHDFVVPIDEPELQESEARAKFGHDFHANKLNLTFTRRDQVSQQSEEQNSRKFVPQDVAAAAATSHSSLWREVSSDYLRELEPQSAKFLSEKPPSRTQPRSERPRPKSFDFGVTLDPPSKLIENFLQRQAASGNLCLDMDMHMMEKLPMTSPSNIAEDPVLLHNNADATETASNSNSTGRQYDGSLGLYQNRQNEGNTTGQVHPRNAARSVPIPTRNFSFQSCGSKGSCSPRSVSFEPQNGGVPGSDARNSKENSGKSAKPLPEQDPDDDGHDTSTDEEENTQIRRSSAKASLNRLMTRSRLADMPPPSPQTDGRSRSGQLKSGLLQKNPLTNKIEEEEDDPLKDEDIPESFRKQKCSFMLVFQWIAFFVIMGGLICSLTVPALINRPLWSMALWKWILLILLLFCGRLVSGWIITVLVVILERNFLLRKRVLYFVYGLRKGVQNCLWFSFALLAWRLVFDPKVESTTRSNVLPVVTKLLNCFLIGAILWLVKIFLVKVLALSFHVSTYFERIRESLFGQWVLETLSGPPVIEIEQEAMLLEEVNDLKKAGANVPETFLPKNNLPAGRSGIINLGKSGVINLGKSGLIGKKSGVIGTGKSGYVSKSGIIGSKSGGLGVKNQQPGDKTQEDGITIENLHRLNQRNISAWNMKRLMNFVRYRGIYSLAHVIDQTAAESPGDAPDVEIQSEWQAKVAANKIFKNVARPGKKYIDRTDLMRFMEESEVEKALPLFEGATESGKISKAALKNFAVHVVRERRALALSLNDTKTAVKKLHRIVDTVVGIVILIVSLLVLGITTTHLLLVISSQLVLVVVIFGNTCKTVFECIVFLFVMHPFDVGDRCVVDGNQLVVEEMNILSTLFMKNDGEKVWYPNSVLATKYIFNYSRTPDTGDNFEFSIDAYTPSEKISLLKDKISKYIASNSSQWTKDFNLVVKSIEDNNKMNMQLMVNHTINYNEDLERKIRKSELILDVTKMLQDLEIGYRLLPQEVHLTTPKCTDEDTHPHLKFA